MSEISKLIKCFEYVDKAFFIGKGSSIEGIDLNILRQSTANSTFVNINDSETIFPGSIAFVSSSTAKASFKNNKINVPVCTYYMSDEHIVSGKTILINKSDEVFTDPELAFSRFNSDSLVIERFSLFTALHFFSMVARKRQKKIEVILLGFDFSFEDGYAKNAIDTRPSENVVFNDHVLKSQYDFLRKLIHYQEGNSIHIKHIGSLPISWMTTEAYSKLVGFGSSYNDVEQLASFASSAASTTSALCKNNTAVKIVAEITTNHFGDRERLFAMIKTAAESGADYIKLQKRNVNTFYSQEQLAAPYDSPFGTTFRDYRDALELGVDDFLEVDRYCKSLSIGWFVSVLDIDSYMFFKDFYPSMIKLPSTISEHRQFLEQVAEDFLGDIVISTGYTEQSYEDFVVAAFKNARAIYLLQCTSAYPTPDEHSQISVVRHYNNLSLKNNKIIPGYSSHDIGSLCSQLAVAAGAKMIEKHVKFGDVSWAHFDEVAVDLVDGSFLTFVNDIRRAEIILGSEIKCIHGSEHHKYWLKKSDFEL